MHSARDLSLGSSQKVSMQSDGMMTLKSSTSDVEVSSNDGTIRLDTRQGSSEGETTQSDILVTAGGRAGMESSLNLLLKSSAETKIISSESSTYTSGGNISVFTKAQDSSGAGVFIKAGAGVNNDEVHDIAISSSDSIDLEYGEISELTVSSRGNTLESNVHIRFRDDEVISH